MIACGMTAFNEVTTTDHCGGFLDLLGTIVLRNRSTPIPSPFDRRLQSNSPIAVRKYKKYLKKNITKRNIEEKLEILVTISKNRKLNDNEEKQFNYLDMNITGIMLKAEKKIVGQVNKSPWSPILHDAVRTVSIWRTLLKQFKPKMCHQSQLKFLLQSMSSPIDT